MLEVKECRNCGEGFLCRSCNIGLGHFDDDLNRFINAYEYITKHKGV